MTFPSYRNMETVPHPWLQALPSHWRLEALKRHARIVTGATPSSTSEAFWDGGIAWATPVDLTAAASGVLTSTARTISEAGLASCATELVPPNSVLLSTRAPIGTVAIAGIATCINQGCRALVTAPSLLPTHLARLLSSWAEHLASLGRGSTFPELSTEALGSLHIPLPPQEEQVSIAQFLDRETAKIDALIAEQERLIELLLEKRQAVISHVVTKGLDPKAPVRDSGVEWLNTIPAHWVAMPVARVLRQHPRYGVLVPDAAVDGVPMLRIVDMENGQATREELAIISAELSAQYSRTILQVGDVVLSVVGTIGETLVIDGRLAGVNISRALARLVPGPAIDPSFLALYLSSKAFEHFTDAVCAGSAQRVLNMDDLRAHRLPVPPLDEQRRITSGIGRAAGELDKLLGRAREAKTLLNERCAALITAAVTGQIDVRGLVEATA